MSPISSGPTTKQQRTAIGPILSKRGLHKIHFLLRHTASHHYTMTTTGTFSTAYDPSFHNKEDLALVVDGTGIGEDVAYDARRAELRAQRDTFMTDLKRQLEVSMDDMRDTAKRLLTEIGAHVNVTHNVIYDYQSVLETQQKEAARLEEVSKTVNSATNPFLETMMSEVQA